MQKQPTLSVILSNYNHAEYLSKQLEAILAQIWQPLELILIDDGSTDDSVSIIQNFLSSHSVIKFIQHQENKGLLYSANEALNIVEGDYVYWASADDLVMPGFFAKAMGIAINYPTAGVIFGKYVTIDDNGQELKTDEVPGWAETMFIPPERFLSDFLYQMPVTQSFSCATVLKRRYLQEISGWRPELDAWTDTFAINAIALNYGACYVPEVFTRFRANPQGFSGSMLRNLKRSSDFISNAIWLMISPEFCDRFPLEYVKYWEENYRHWLIQQHTIGVNIQLSHLQMHLDRLQADLKVAVTKLEQVWMLNDVLDRFLQDTLKLQEYNFIVFLDWQQPDQLIAKTLREIIHAFLKQKTYDKVTLLLESSEIESERADSLISDILLSLFMEEEVLIRENLEIQLTGMLTSHEWNALIPYLTAKFVFYDGGSQFSLTELELDKLPDITVESLSSQEIF